MVQVKQIQYLQPLWTPGRQDMNISGEKQNTLFSVALFAVPCFHQDADSDAWCEGSLLPSVQSLKDISTDYFEK